MSDVQTARLVTQGLLALSSRQQLVIPHRRTDGREPVDLLTWSVLWRRQLRPGVYFSLRDHLYLVDIYRLAASVPRLVVKKAGQIGVSELMVSYAFHACVERKMDILYLMPTAEDVGDFSRMRFAPALEASPELDRIMMPPPHGSLGSDVRFRGADKVTLKRVADNWLIFRGGQVGADGSARQLKSVPADAVIADEVDEMDEQTLPIARKRLGHSPIKEERLVSTPSYAERGIDAEWRESDQREWFIPCPSCGHWQFLTIHHVVHEFDALGRPVSWNGMKDDDAWAACEKCGARMDRLAPGRWVARYPGRDVVGFHPTKLTAPHTSLLTIVQNLCQISESKQREAWNQDLGEVYTPRGGRLTDEHLRACIRDYGHGPQTAQRPFMGVDVGRVLHVIIRGETDPETGEVPQLFAGEVPTFEEASRLLTMYRVKTCVVDALPETREARKFQDAHPKGVVWLCWYDGDDGSSSKEVSAVRWDEKDGKLNVRADRTRILDEMYEGIYEQRLTLPAHIETVVPDYFPHLRAPVRMTVTKPGGKEIVVYDEGSRADHYAHAEVYALIARQRPAGVQSAPARRVSLRNRFQ